MTDDFINFGCFSINLKTLILNMIVLLWIFNLLAICINFSFSWNLFKIFPWWYATDIMPFFVRRISSYCLIISAASSGFCTFSASLFRLSTSIALLMIMDSINCFLISSMLRRSFVFSTVFRVSPHLKQKITTIP